MAKKRSIKIAEDLADVARKMFGAAGKNAYYLGSTAIKNLEELKQNLDKFTEREAKWLASWIEYLGDSKTAQKIRESTKDFKKIILDRYNQLRAYR